MNIQLEIEMAVRDTATDETPETFTRDIDDCAEPRQQRPTKLIEQLKDAGQDHEFYPTTDEIIRKVAGHIGSGYGRCGQHGSILDIGAGNGKVLKALAKRCDHLRDLHAIEKSPILCEQLDSDILIVGTDFHEQSLLSKQVDVIFCNPPYSEFEDWTEKIIRQAASNVIYLVIPQRWENSDRIKDALRFRGVEARTLGKFDFENAEDRRARAVVSLLCIDLERENGEAFDLFFEEQFADLINKFKASETRPEGETGARAGGEKAHDFKDLVPGPNYPEAMVAVYNAEMEKINKNYQLVGQLDVALLKEFNINPPTILKCLKTRLAGLKNDYWMELFSRLDTVTNRLTSSSRKAVLDRLHKHVQVDFTVSNIYQIVLWLIKNANHYIDSQLIDVYELMVAKCNVILYKSNQKTWVENGWRYSREEADPNSHYALDYRIVTHRAGGITSGYSSRNGLDESACNFLGDLRTIARNLGFTPAEEDNIWRLDRWNSHASWIAGKTQEFHFVNRNGKREVLFDVKAFKNRNLHIRLNKAFILALNVEHGRLKGWIRTGREAAEELCDGEAAQYFNANQQISAGNPMLLLAE